MCREHMYQNHKESRKLMRSCLLGGLCAVALCLAPSARADLIITPIAPFGNDASKKDVGASPAQVYNWLGQQTLPVPLAPLASVQTFDNLNGTGPTLPISGPAYLVLHYGVGNGGTPGTGGGIVALFFNGTGSYAVPSNGSGRNGFGGISFAQLFQGMPTRSVSRSVPDGGTTLPLLAMGIAGLIGAARLRNQRAHR